MSKFLNEVGLSYFWTKVKDFIKSKYVAIGNNIYIGDTSMSKNGFGTQTNPDSNGNYKSASLEAGNIQVLEHRGNTDSDTTLGISAGEINMSEDESNLETSITPGIVKTNDKIISDKIVKNGGTALQVLLANGEVATFNEAGGIPKLDNDGLIPLNLLGNFDTSLFITVSSLPTDITDINLNKIYLVPSSDTDTQNVYAEYIYTGKKSMEYDASKWEKLGEYKNVGGSGDVDLSNYSKKSETITNIEVDTSSLLWTVLKLFKADSKSSNIIIPGASQTAAGIMTASDKKALDTLTARYPLTVSKFTATPSLVEVGAAADITFAWDYTNTDFHTISAQSIVVDGAAAVTVENGTKSYKKTALAGATTATTKTARLTVNSSLSIVSLTKDVTITYHYPSYIGVIANGTVLNETVVKNLTKSIEAGKGKTATLTQTNQKIVYAYPASYGNLTSIKDGNGFQGFAGYTKQTMTINGQSYNVYVQNLPATASSTYTFA